MSLVAVFSRLSPLFTKFVSFDSTLQNMFPSRAELDAEIERLSSVVENAKGNCTNLDLLQEGAAAEEILPVLKSLCKDKKFWSKQDIQHQMDQLELSLTNEKSLKNRIPIAREINYLTSRLAHGSAKKQDDKKPAVNRPEQPMPIPVFNRQEQVMLSPSFRNQERTMPSPVNSGGSNPNNYFVAYTDRRPEEDVRPWKRRTHGGFLEDSLPPSAGMESAPVNQWDALASLDQRMERLETLMASVAKAVEKKDSSEPKTDELVVEALAKLNDRLSKLEQILETQSEKEPSKVA